MKLQEKEKGRLKRLETSLEMVDAGGEPSKLLFPSPSFWFFLLFVAAASDWSLSPTPVVVVAESAGAVVLLLLSPSRSL